MTAIYVLVNPENGRVGYVGRTENPGYRLEQHWKSKTPFGTTKERWLWGLYEDDTEPEMEIVDEVPKHAAKGAEHLWMARFAAAGAGLTNTEMPPEVKDLLEQRLEACDWLYEKGWYGLSPEDQPRRKQQKQKTRPEPAETVLKLIYEEEGTGGPAEREGVSEERIIEMASGEGLPERAAKEAIKHLKNERGKIYSPDMGETYKTVAPGPEVDA